MRDHATALVDTSENRTDWYTYLAHGYTYVLRQGQYTPFKFVGHHGYYSDGDSGMVLLGHRYYIPLLHRFLTQDPRGHDAGLNLYQYAENNPLRNVDPTGEEIPKSDYTLDHRDTFERIGAYVGLGPAGWNFERPR